MKTFITLISFFISLSHLSAQFYLKVSLDEDGVYAIKLKSEIEISPGSVIGSGLISLIAPYGGFKIGKINSVNGKWFSDGVLGKDFHYPLVHEYHFIWLNDRIDILEGLDVGKEIILFTFENIGVCTGAIELYTDQDPIAILQDSLENIPTSYFYHSRVALDLNTFDPLKSAVYNVSGVYDKKEAICQPDNPNISTSTENVALKNSILVQPNPMKQSALIQFSNPNNKENELIINDLSGRIFRRITNLRGE